MLLIVCVCVCVCVRFCVKFDFVNEFKRVYIQGAPYSLHDRFI